MSEMSEAQDTVYKLANQLSELKQQAKAAGEHAEIVSDQMRTLRGQIRIELDALATITEEMQNLSVTHAQREGQLRLLQATIARLVRKYAAPKSGDTNDDYIPF